jgi:protein-S-isoprenylcysteine O-methyltransferase Ste14
VLYTVTAVGDTRGVPVPYEELSNPARVVLYGSVGAFAAAEVAQALRRRRDATRVDVRAEVALRLMLFAAVLTLPLGRAVVPGAVIGGGVAGFAVGTVLAWVGLLVRWWSFATLGRLFTVVVVTSADQPVVDRGPYRLLRHPSYSGLILAFAGVGVMLGNWASAAGATALLSVALIFRLRVEERALTAALGDRYRQFAATRARLIPYVW